MTRMARRKRQGERLKRTEMKRREGVRRVNTKRKKDRHATNYGEKADFIRAQRCFVSGRTEDIVAAHPVPKGHSQKEGLVPFHAEVETDWHGLDEAKFEAKWKRSKQMCRDAAAMYEDRWQCHQRGEVYDVAF